MPEDFAQSNFFCMMPHNVKACLLQCELESTFNALETQSTSKNVGSLAEVGNLVCRHRIVEMVQPEAEEEVLPPEANATLFLSGLPLDITKREVAHILRPFEGFKVSLFPFFSSHCDKSCGIACIVSLGDLHQAGSTLCPILFIQSIFLSGNDLHMAEPQAALCSWRRYRHFYSVCLTIATPAAGYEAGAKGRPQQQGCHVVLCRVLICAAGCARHEGSPGQPSIMRAGLYLPPDHQPKSLYVSVTCVFHMPWLQSLQVRGKLRLSMFFIWTEQLIFHQNDRDGSSC